MRLKPATLSMVWILTIVAGMSAVWTHELSPGIPAKPSPMWPVASKLPRPSNMPVLVMLAHPRCPCTRASIEELAKLMASMQGRLSSHVLFYTPKHSSLDSKVLVEKHKVLQVLVNLISNAKYAMDDGKPPNKQLTMRIGMNGNNHFKIAVTDNGIGIPAENLTRIFAHGFTTKKTGHGFGLHSGALAVREMGGALLVHSDGPGKGATFTLELPLKLEEGNE